MAFTTRVSLLSAVRKGDEIGWQDFYDNYKPLILLRGGDHKLNQTEKEELVQLVMLAFFRQSETFVYDRALGRFRDYLKCITDHQAFDLMNKRKDGTVSITANESEINDLLAKSDDVWEKEWEKYVLNNALNEVKSTVEPETYQIFHAITFDEMPITEAASIFNKSPNTIYAIKHRVAKKLKEIYDSFDE